MSRKIIIFGSLNMDFSIACDEVPKQGETLEGKELLISEGGKGANQALACKKLGADVAMIGSVGDDKFSTHLIQNLTKNGICTKNIQKVPDCSSGMAFIIRCNSDNRIIINKGANHHIKDTKSILQKLANTGELKAGDIFICQLECDIKATELALKSAKELGLYTIFNPAPAKAIAKEYFKYIDLFILNQSEAEFYTKIYATGKSEIKNCLNHLKDFGASEVILTLSANGCAYLKDEVKFFSAYKVNPVDTTAAGDTFIGGVAAALAKGEDIEAAIVLGSRAAALSTLKMGAASSIPDINEVNNYYKD